MDWCLSRWPHCRRSPARARRRTIRTRRSGFWSDFRPAARPTSRPAAGRQVRRGLGQVGRGRKRDRRRRQPRRRSRCQGGARRLHAGDGQQCHRHQSSLYDKLPYDAARDLAPISRAVVMPIILVVHDDVPARRAATHCARPPRSRGSSASVTLASGRRRRWQASCSRRGPA